MAIQLASYTAGRLEKGVGYKYFVPSQINDEWEWSDTELHYDKLMRVREKNEMLKWLKYFLISIAETAEGAVNTLAEVFDLKKKLEAEIHSGWGRRILISHTNYASHYSSIDRPHPAYSV